MAAVIGKPVCCKFDAKNAQLQFFERSFGIKVFDLAIPNLTTALDPIAYIAAIGTVQSW